MKPFFEAIPLDKQHPSWQLLEVELFKCGTYWHYHPQVELTYVLRGSGIRMMGDHLGQFQTLNSAQQIISLMQILLLMSEHSQIAELCSASFARWPLGIRGDHLDE